MTNVDYFVNRLRSGTMRYDARAGRIYTVPDKRGRKTPKPDREKGNWYVKIAAVDGGIEYTALAHVVIWNFLHGPVPEGLEVHHKDGIRHHNQESNLGVLTHSENVVEGIKLRRKQETKRFYSKRVA